MQIDSLSQKALNYINNSKKEKVLVVFSGGLDSTTAVYMYKHLGYEVGAVSFNYGQRHSIELEYAKKTCEKLNIKHYIMEVPIPSENSCLKNKNIEVPEGHYQDETMRITVVNNRNAIMLSLAAALAIDAKYTKVALGIHTGDHFIYPDCREEFFEHLKKATLLGNEGRISKEFDILAPFLKKDKTDIAELAILLGVPLEETYSDYEGGEVQRACSGTSVERIEAISLAYTRIEELEKPYKKSHSRDTTQYKDKEFALDLLITRAKDKRLLEIL